MKFYFATVFSKEMVVNLLTNLKAEVLSPVGSWEMLTAAVRSGADAVFFGAKDFSARRNAENFTIDEIREVVEYCHTRAVKAYLTLNILIKDTELEKAFDLAKSAYNYGIDGIIIQDLGLAKILKENLPNLTLHASTQMSVHSPSALPVLKSLGFKRVVVAREMSFENLKEFCAAAKQYDIEVEAFVHGALCMCLSGQCLLSAVLGSRSGNRGLCAGPCRLPFKVKGGTGYDLSLKDLSLIEYLNELKNIGVCSFKIEGRMRRPEYVAAATTACRKALDNGAVEVEISKMLSDVFSRSGFTDGYYTNNLGKNMFGIRTKDDVNLSAAIIPKIHEFYRNERQSVGVNVEFCAKESTPVSLKISDGENEICVTGEIPALAQNKAANRESVLKNLNKFGGTPYFARDIKIDLADGLFLRAGDINELRRSAVEKLNVLRSKTIVEISNKNFVFQGAPTQRKTKPQIYVRVENENQIPTDLSGVSALIYSLELSHENLPQNIKIIVDIPRAIVSEEQIKQKLKNFKSNGVNVALCGNLAAVQIAKELGFEIIADTGLNIFNSFSCETAQTLGISSVVLSSETLIEDAQKINSGVPKGIVSYGKIPLMIFKNCPIKNGKNCNECDKNGVLTDRLNVEFPVRCRMGYSEMLNSLPIWLADKQNLLNTFDFQILYFTKETKEEVCEVIAAYKKGLPPEIKYTRGLYFRGTM